MLTNKELTQISNAIPAFTTIKVAFLESEDFNLYEQTGLTLIDIERNIKALNHIHTHYALEKMKQSDKVAQYHKDNAEKHREYNREWARKNYQRKKECDKTLKPKGEE